MSNISVNAVLATQDMFLSIAEQADFPTIARLARVCKLWNAFLNSPQLWKKLSEKEGIPLVECRKGQERDLKSDFRILYPITISGKMISEFFGKMVGKVPPVQEAIFNRLNLADPFEKAKRIKDNYIFVVMPGKIQRTVDETTPLDLDADGNLIKLPPGTTIVKHDLMIPFSLKNLRMLCAYPLKGKENTPVFDKDSWDEVFNQCSSSSNKVTVYFMRKHVADKTRNKSYAVQQELVKSERFEITPLIERALFDAVEILQSGTCPDDQNPLTYARTSDVIRSGTSVYQSAIGGFAPRVGVSVHSYHSFFGYDNVGVVPGVPAEVLRP